MQSVFQVQKSQRQRIFEQLPPRQLMCLPSTPTKKQHNSLISCSCNKENAPILINSLISIEQSAKETPFQQPQQQCQQCIKLPPIGLSKQSTPTKRSMTPNQHLDSSHSISNQSSQSIQQSLEQLSNFSPKTIQTILEQLDEESRKSSFVLNRPPRPSSKSSKLEESKREKLLNHITSSHTLINGFLMQKYGRKDYFLPSQRIVQITPDFKHLVLKGPNNLIHKIIPMNHIFQIQLGRRTENFKRFKTSYIKEGKSCSLIMKERTLDLETESQKHLEVFARSLVQVLQTVCQGTFTGCVEH